MTSIVICGAAGRMGRTLVRCAAGMPSIRLVGAVESAGHPELGKDAGLLADGAAAGVPLTSDLSAALQRADVLIDFTLHTAAPGNVRAAAAARRAVVLGATGLNAAETAAVTAASAHVPIVWAPNMSLGVNLLFAMARRAAETLGADYTIEIDETHHVHKKDAPSGTALRLGEKVAEGRGLDFARAMVHDETGAASPAADRIVIRSHREGEVVGNHTVRFASPAERVVLTHEAESRDAFALGALRAAAWVVSRRPRLYDMQDVLNLR